MRHVGSGGMCWLPKCRQEWRAHTKQVKKHTQTHNFLGSTTATKGQQQSRTTAATTTITTTTTGQSCCGCEACANLIFMVSTDLDLFLPPIEWQTHARTHTHVRVRGCIWVKLSYWPSCCCFCCCCLTRSLVCILVTSPKQADDDADDSDWQGREGEWRRRERGRRDVLENNTKLSIKRKKWCRGCASEAIRINQKDLLAWKEPEKGWKKEEARECGKCGSYWGVAAEDTPRLSSHPRVLRSVLQCAGQNKISLLLSCGRMRVEFCAFCG